MGLLSGLDGVSLVLLLYIRAFFISRGTNRTYSLPTKYIKIKGDLL